MTQDKPERDPLWMDIIGWVSALCFCACLVLLVVGAAKSVLG